MPGTSSPERASGKRPPIKRAVQSRTVDVQRRILDAAVEVLLEDGYGGATTLRIQEQAGVTRGRLLHHFPSRDTLLTAAAHHLASARVAEMGADQIWPADPAERIDAAIEAMALTFTQGYFWAATELWIAARHNDDLRAALLPGERDLARVIRPGLDAFFGPDLTTHADFDDLREILFTSLRGMALTTAFDPREEPTRRHIERLKKLARSVLLD
ncbi:TetR/AcrR family transcriptional regulator [Nocardioides sp. WS12]|uniref:TetR/AcrR family transcriptional regulator n=1 Tax=Nocardioides sp. WS12 TaxID=2486272 RepID=UPI0015F8842E|nr:TetR/AcrR family transcriptional regulator [Nocardioides sp. WS12]